MLDSSSWLRKSASHVENSGFESPIEYQCPCVHAVQLRALVQPTKVQTRYIN